MFGGSEKVAVNRSFTNFSLFYRLNGGVLRELVHWRALVAIMRRPGRHEGASRYEMSVTRMCSSR